MGNLSGLRILDLADEKGMFGTKLLADMGAEVIKVERPGGDPTRNIGPFFGNTSHPEKSLYFWYYNANKLGITLNLEKAPGRQIFRRLVARSDVVVETFPPNYLSALELDYPHLSELNPALIMTSITNFGQSGPYRDYQSSDIVASALGGQAYLCGEPDLYPKKSGDFSGSPDLHPINPYGEQAYLIASLFGAIGTLLAWHYRCLTGQGQQVDISMQESVTATIEPAHIRYYYDGVVTQRQGGWQWNHAFGIFPCRDGYILLSLFQQWETLIEWLDSEGMAGDLKEAKWQSQEVRQREIDHIIQIIGQWTNHHSAAELVELGQLMRFPWAEVCSIDELAQSPQLEARNFFAQVSHPELKTAFRYPGSPRGQITRRAPLIGEHNEEILGRELGISGEKLNQLAEEGVI
jgi:crotonobetainyl-CoA:carnitine CoA-transferase CaiB-like acyl-CoA transferase